MPQWSTMYGMSLVSKVYCGFNTIRYLLQKRWTRSFLIAQKQNFTVNFKVRLAGWNRSRIWTVESESENRFFLDNKIKFWMSYDRSCLQQEFWTCLIHHSRIINWRLFSSNFLHRDFTLLIIIINGFKFQQCKFKRFQHGHGFIISRWFQFHI